MIYQKMTLFHLRSICSCGNLVHVPSCPLFGKCPFCGKCQTTCRLLKTCRKLFHPKRCTEDHQKLVKTYRELCTLIDDFGRRIYAIHCARKLSEQFLARLAKLNTEYNSTKRQLPVDVNQLNKLETILAKIRRVFIDVKASQQAQLAQSAQSAQPDQLAQSAQSAQSAQPDQLVQQTQSAQPAQPAQPDQTVQPAQPTGN